ncbi:MAG: Bro-N domain-containing protein [Rhodospirillum sp.]|nr:Bro-N domain-containing protein [Rhodospirillum sp.]
MNDVTPFAFEGSDFRVVSRDGEPWFVLVDVCSALEIANPSRAASRLDDDEKYTLRNMKGIADARVQEITIINESGLYSLTFSSRKPQAKRFKKWVTAEVLPTIRRTGRYGADIGFHSTVTSGRPYTVREEILRPDGQWGPIWAVPVYRIDDPGRTHSLSSGAGGGYSGVRPRGRGMVNFASLSALPITGCLPAVARSPKDVNPFARASSSRGGRSSVPPTALAAASARIRLSFRLAMCLSVATITMVRFLSRRLKASATLFRVSFAVATMMGRPVI